MTVVCIVTNSVCLSLNAEASHYVLNPIVIQLSAAYPESMHEFSSRSIHWLLRKLRNDLWKRSQADLRRFETRRGTCESTMSWRRLRICALSLDDRAFIDVCVSLRKFAAAYFSSMLPKCRRDAEEIMDRSHLRHSGYVVIHSFIHSFRFPEDVTAACR